MQHEKERHRGEKKGRNGKGSARKERKGQKGKEMKGNGRKRDEKTPIRKVNGKKGSETNENEQSGSTRLTLAP